MSVFYLPSIRAKLLALFLVAAVLPITLVSVLSYFNSLRSVEKMVGNRTSRLVQTVGDDLQKKMSRRITDGILVMNEPVQDFLRAAGRGDPISRFQTLAVLGEYMNSLFNEEYAGYYDELIVADAQGIPLAKFNRAGAASAIDTAGIVPEVPPTAPAPPSVEDVRRTPLEDMDRSVPRTLEETTRIGIEISEKMARDMAALARRLERVQNRNEAMAVFLDSLHVSTDRKMSLLITEQVARLIAQHGGRVETDPEDMPEPEVGRTVRPTLPYSGVFTEREKQAALMGVDLDQDQWILYFDRSETGQPLLRLVRPIFSVKRKDLRLGTLVADLRTDYLFPAHLRSQHFGTMGELAVVNTENGEILFHTREELTGERLSRVDRDLTRMLQTAARDPGKSEAWRKVGGPERTRIASVFGLDQAPWQVVATAVPREFEKEARTAGLWNLLVASLTLLAAGTVLLVASDRVSRSIHVVTAGANEIAAGNLDHAIRVETHDEIETLAEAFNSMTSSLRENIALKEKAARELEVLNRSLEDRVRERTRELEALNEILNRANQELKELDRMKTNFLSTVSHEFRTPLTSIQAFSEILLDEVPDAGGRKEIRRFLGIINSESERLGRLIKNLLDLSRIESGRIVWERHVFAVEEVLDAALEGLLPLFGEKEIKVQREIACPGARVEADRDRVQQVITNLCENAVKFSDRGKRLWVTCRPAPPGDGRPFVEVAVRDEGPGIRPEHLEKIFERFWQVDNTETRAAGGTGLGLAISKEIVEHHGGRIWAESERGEGTVIRFTLPVHGGVGDERSAHG